MTALKQRRVFPVLFLLALIVIFCGCFGGEDDDGDARTDDDTEDDSDGDDRDAIDAPDANGPDDDNQDCGTFCWTVAECGLALGWQGDDGDKCLDYCHQAAEGSDLFVCVNDASEDAYWDDCSPVDDCFIYHDVPEMPEQTE